MGERQSSPTHGEPNNNEIRTESTEPNVLGVASCSHSVSFKRVIPFEVIDMPGSKEKSPVEITVNSEKDCLNVNLKIPLSEFDKNWLEHVFTLLNKKNITSLNPLWTSIPQETDRIDVELAKHLTTE